MPELMYLCPSCDRRFRDPAVAFCTEDGTRLVPFEDALSLVGQVVDDRYEVRALLGAGGMGAVYRVFQRSVEREIAMKVLKRSNVGDALAIKRFFKEARAASQLRHPNTVTVFDFGQTQDGLLYMTMELLDGVSLGDLLARDGPLPAARAVNILGQICDSLAEAHERGIVHRDLKPDNIVIVKLHGHGDFVKVLDFGIAKIVAGGPSSGITATGLVCGTPVYMSPEAAQERLLDGRADIYALGVMLYEVLSGAPPFVSETPVGVLMKHVSEPVPKLTRPGVPASLERVLYRMLAKDPNERPATVMALRDELRAAVADTTVAPTASHTAPAPSVRTQPTEDSNASPMALATTGTITGFEQSLRRRRKIMRAVALAAAAAVAAVVLSVAWPRSEPASPAAAASHAVAAEAPVAAAGVAIRREPVAESKLERRLPAEDAAAAAVLPPPPQPPPRVSIRATQGVSDVDEGGAKIGATPFPCDAPAAGRDLVLRRAGFEDAKVHVDPSSPPEVVVTLKPKARRVHDRELKPL